MLRFLKRLASSGTRAHVRAVDVERALAESDAAFDAVFGTSRVIEGNDDSDWSLWDDAMDEAALRTDNPPPPPPP